MINKIRRYYNQNRRTIIISIIIIAFLLFMLQILIRTSREKNNTIIVDETSYNRKTNSFNIITNMGNATTTEKTQNTINNTNSNNKTNSFTDVINTFVEYCNDKKIDQAYDLLTDDCKKVIFPNIEKFKTEYYNKIFGQKRLVNIEKSIYGDSIYKVTYHNNILSMGSVANDKLVDYIYIDDNKISINQFLNLAKIDKKMKNEQVEVEVIEKETYLEYEVYKIKFTNYSGKDILIDSQKDNNTINIADKNGVEYVSYINQVSQEELIIKAYSAREMKIKFNKNYNFKREIVKMKFSDIITDYIAYKNGNEYDRTTFIIEI